MSPPEAYIRMLALEANIGNSGVVGQVYLSERCIHNVKCAYAAIFHHDRTCVLRLCAVACCVSPITLCSYAPMTVPILGFNCCLSPSPRCLDFHLVQQDERPPSPRRCCFSSAGWCEKKPLLWRRWCSVGIYHWMWMIPKMAKDHGHKDHGHPLFWPLQTWNSSINQGNS